MRNDWQLRKPELDPVYQTPIWFHHHGGKMHFEGHDNERGHLVIASKAAVLKISRADIPTDQIVPGFSPVSYWELEWKVQQSLSEEAVGKAFLRNEELRMAFDLAVGPVPVHSRWLIDRYGGDSAHQGKFIRWDKFLNIPCPGTGHDGDPNISILIDEEMHGEILKLLEWNDG